MSEYPKRGEFSADGRYYTHVDGSVHEGVKWDGCENCSLDEYCDTVELQPCSGLSAANGKTMFAVVEGVCVPSNDAIEASEMARAMIRLCAYFRGLATPAQMRHGCERCSEFSNKSCPGRAFLAKHGQDRAWEVKL